MKKLSRSFTVNYTIIDRIIDSYNFIKKFPYQSSIESRAIINSKILSISRSHGVLNSFDDAEIEASINLIENFYSHFCVNNSFNEISIAFELCLGNKIDVNTNIYYGKFTINLLANVLAGYAVYRNKVIFDYTKELEKELKSVSTNEEMTEKEYEALQNMKKEYLQMVESCKFPFLEKAQQQAKQDEISQNYSFPHWWIKPDSNFNYKNFLFLGKKILISEDIKNSLVEKTKIYVRNSYLKDFSNENNDKRIAAKREIFLLDKGKKSEDYFAKSKSVFFRFVVLYFIMNPEEVNLF